MIFTKNNMYNASVWNVYKFGFWVDYIKIIREGDKLILSNIVTGERITGIDKINKYLRVKELEVRI